MNDKDRCQIARDLMPLSVDGVCSPGSQRFLDAHVAACPPCQTVYEQMKAAPLSPCPVEPVQEEAALRQGLKRLGQRFRWLWIALGALASAFALLLVIAGVNQLLWNRVATAPVNTYSVTLYRNDAQLHLNLCADFPKHTFKDSRCDMRTIGQTAENHTGAPEAVILTWSVRYLPVQARDFFETVTVNTFQGFVTPGGQLSDPQDGFRYMSALDAYGLCVDDGGVYLVGSQEGIPTATGRTLMLLHPGLPVSEIRVTDGRETLTLYTWGDEIPDYSAAVDEHGLPVSGFISPTDYERLRDIIE